MALDKNENSKNILALISFDFNQSNFISKNGSIWNELNLLRPKTHSAQNTIFIDYLIFDLEDKIKEEIKEQKRNNILKNFLSFVF